MFDFRCFPFRNSVLVLAIITGAFGLEAGDRPLTFEDLMKFRQIQDASISENGAWIAYALVPDRGDGEAVAQSTTSDTLFRIERGEAPEISAYGLWVAAAITPTLEEREGAKAKKGKKYANKIDYSIKMKEFFDHWLKGSPAPGWMTDGVPYRGE